MEAEKGTVCVTGGTGFIASWTVKSLLAHGYSVRTTIRPDPENKRDVSFLTNLPGASEKLKYITADLNDPESFGAAIEGCTGVFHMATPVDFEDKEPIELVVNRAVNGTIGILKACLNSKTVQRVVYTSSASAVVFNDTGAETMDEGFWSDLEVIKAMKVKHGKSYFLSKTLTEKAAIEFAERHGLDLVTVVPPFVVGPFICSKFPSSVRDTLPMLLGKKDELAKLLNTSLVHVEDVARAHIFLLEHPNPKGRYVCSHVTISIEEMAKFLQARYPEYPILSADSVREIKGYKIPGLSYKKLIDSGFEFEYGLEDMFDGAIQCCKEKGYL